MQAALGVSRSTWGHKRNQFLDNLSIYYDYEVSYKRNSRFYRILKKKGEYQELKRKNDKAEREAAYQKEILEEIFFDRFHTAASISRIIKDKPSIKVYGHKDSTVYEYTRVRMNAMFGVNGTHGKIVGRVWCKIDKETGGYEEMTEEENQDFKVFIDTVFVSAPDEEKRLLKLYEAGAIDEDELSERLHMLKSQIFKDAKAAFKEKHDFFPIRVNEYALFDEDILIFE